MGDKGKKKTVKKRKKPPIQAGDQEDFLFGATVRLGVLILTSQGRRRKSLPPGFGWFEFESTIGSVYCILHMSYVVEAVSFQIPLTCKLCNLEISLELQ